MIKRATALSLCVIALAACGRKPDSGKADRHYELTGRILALDSRNHTATVDAAAIPGFMEAMTMEYPVQSQQEFQQLQVGERIKADLIVHGDNNYDLSNIRRQDASQ
jgi:protein SCO1